MRKKCQIVRIMRETWRICFISFAHRKMVIVYLTSLFQHETLAKNVFTIENLTYSVCWWYVWFFLFIFYCLAYVYTSIISEWNTRRDIGTYMYNIKTEYYFNKPVLLLCWTSRQTHKYVDLLTPTVYTETVPLPRTRNIFFED